MERCYHVEGFVEKQFLRPVHLGSTIAPYRAPGHGLPSSHGTVSNSCTAMKQKSTTTPGSLSGGVAPRTSGLGTTSRTVTFC